MNTALQSQSPELALKSSPSAHGRFPDFLIIGAARSGTSSLYLYLMRHPRIYLSTPKEPTFFSHPDVFVRGVPWYQSLFEKAETDQLCGEASTTYTRWPHTLDASALLHRVVPRAKLIYLLRHPVERAFSHYRHHMRKGVTMTFEEALSRDSIYVDCSRYTMQIERYLRFFSPTQLLFVFLEDLESKPRNVLPRIQEFLGLDVEDLLEPGRLRATDSGPEYYIRYRLESFLERVPTFKPIANRLPSRVRKSVFRLAQLSRFGKRWAADARVPPMAIDTRRRLCEELREDVLGLSGLVGRDLSHWLQ